MIPDQQLAYVYAETAHAYNAERTEKEFREWQKFLANLSYSELTSNISKWQHDGTIVNGMPRGARMPRAKDLL